LPAIALYLVVTIALLLTWDRFVGRISVAAAIVLILIPFCFTGRAMLTGKVYAPIDLPFMAEPLKDYAADYGFDKVYNGTLSDLYAQIIPWQSAVRQALAHGEWPLWNPFLLCGNILAANMQAAPYDAVNVLGLLLAHPQALTFAAAMTFFFAAFFTFAFARLLGLSEVASLIAAAGYTFCALIAFFVGWPLGRAWTLLPLVFAAVRLIVRERSLRGAVMLTIALALTIFAGHPESVLHIVATGAAYGVFELAITRQQTLRAIAIATVSGLAALGLTAILLMPFFSAAPQTKEYDLRHNLYAKADFVTVPETVARRAGATFFPFYGGQPERDNFTSLWQPTSARVGSLILALAAAALVVAPRRREVWFFFGLALIGLCAGFDAPPVAHLLHELPVFDIALNDRLAFAAAFALAMLAGIAVDSWKRRGVIAMAIVGVALAVGTFAIRESQLAAGVDPALLHGLMLVELVPLAFFGVRRLAAAFPAAILALILLQRTLEDGAIYPTLRADAFYPRVPVLAAMPVNDPEPFRMVGLHFALIPDGAALYGLEDARGYEAMTFRRLAETYPLWCRPQDISFNNVPEMWRPFLNFLNVRYAVTSKGVHPEAGWRVLAEDRESRLLENPNALPRAYVPRHIRYEQNGVAVLEGMAKEKDFANRAWITVPHYPPHEIANGPGTVTVRRDGFSVYDLDVTMALDGWVVLSDSRWPGWRAYIDGKRVETHDANHAFIGIFVPAGKHKVRLMYRPEAFTRGRNVTILTALLALAFLVLRHRFQKPRAVRV
jgi:Bacterial membrane protein YfhO